jgi:pyruvate formate-lyase/glycerol dehydratase family glycyl radical enzyme
MASNRHTEVSSKVTSIQTEMTRGQRLWSMLLDRRDKEPVSLERAKLVTASYKETEGLPTPIRRAKAFEKIVTEIPIYIDEDQLLVGDFGSRPMAAEWHPEYAVEWVVKDFESGAILHKVAEGDVLAMKEIYDYWKDKAVLESFKRYKGEREIKELTDMCEGGAWIHTFFQELESDKSWYAPNFEKAIRKGLRGILVEVEEELEATSPTDDMSRDKVYFLQALAMVLRAGVGYGKRYAALARELAKSAEGKRKAELELIAEVCDWVPENPARSFHEALQTMWFCEVLMFWDTQGIFAVAPGRVDQYFYPYYKRDLEEGKLNREGALELLECLRVKMSSGRRFRGAAVSRGFSGEAMFLNCTLGGQMPDGKDATNELSYLWLEAAMRTRTPHPTLSIRWHESLSPDFAMKGAELNRLGLGFPAWFGDKTSIEYLLKMGTTLEEARGYTLAGCVLHVIPGRTAACWPIIMSMPKVLELTLWDGFDPVAGKQFGLKTGRFENFKTYDDLYQAYKKHVRFFLTRAAKDLNEARLFTSGLVPQLFASCLFDDCIRRGQNALGGGSRYQQGSMYLLPIGIIDVADSLAAVRKCVYEEGSISNRELMEALQVNFEGKEDLRRLLLSAPKYGNGDDYVDRIAADLYSWLCELLGEIDACYGAKYVCAPHSLSFQGPAGRKVGALPSGRLAGLALADGGVSPCQGADSNGPTAVIRSAGRIDHTPIFGTLFNMKFHPSALKTREDLQKFLSLIKTYFHDYGGKHIQFNVIDRGTLLDAQKHPERYRNLVIRVAGYSALWVELDAHIQDEIIKRTEHGF